MPNGFTMTTRMNYTSETSFGPYVENNWHFSYNPLVTILSVAVGQAQDAIAEFWNSTAPTNLATMGSYVPAVISNTIQTSYVDWEDPDNISVPYDSFTLSGTRATTTLPSEVASCLTFKCDPYDSLPRQSLYNRIYLGPLGTVALNGLTSQARPHPGFMADALLAYEAFADVLDVFGVDNCRHAVYSPKNDSSALVTSVWMDNAFDIQRRRGVEATAKVTFTP